MHQCVADILLAAMGRDRSFASVGMCEKLMRAGLFDRHKTKFVQSTDDIARFQYRKPRHV